MSIEIAIFASVIIGVVAGLMLENMRRRIEPEPAGILPVPAAPLRLTGPGSAFGRVADSAADLRLVSDAGFASKPLLSGRDADVLAVVESIAGEAGLGWRVVPQVRLADILASSDADANAAIGEHRVDMLIVSASRMPVAAVDYQALGQLRDDAALRDAVKREALRRAAIPFLEARANEPLDVLRDQILRLAVPSRPARPVRPRAAVKAAKPATKAAAKAATKPAVAKARPAPAAVVAPVAVPVAATITAPVAAPPSIAATPAAKASKPAAKAAKPAAKAAKPAAKPAAKSAPAAAKASAKPAAKPAATKAPRKAPPAEP